MGCVAYQSNTLNSAQSVMYLKFFFSTGFTTTVKILFFDLFPLKIAIGLFGLFINDISRKAKL